MSQDRPEDSSQPDDINHFTQVPDHAMALFTRQMSVCSLTIFKQADQKAARAVQAEMNLHHGISFFCRVFAIQPYEVQVIFTDLIVALQRHFNQEITIEECLELLEHQIRSNDYYAVCSDYASILSFKHSASFLQQYMIDVGLFKVYRHNAIYGRGHTGWLNDKQTGVFLTLLSIYCKDLDATNTLNVARCCIIKSRDDPEAIQQLINSFCQCVADLQPAIDATQLMDQEDDSCSFMC